MLKVEAVVGKWEKRAKGEGEEEDEEEERERNKRDT